MCRGRFRQWGRRGGRALFPETLPPPLNHAVVTGKLLGDRRPGWGPSEEPVTLLEVEFPVAHPEHPRFLWAYATYDVEVPGHVGGSELEEMRKDALVMVAGQLSERLSIHRAASAAPRSPRLRGEGEFEWRLLCTGNLDAGVFTPPPDHDRAPIKLGPLTIDLAARRAHVDGAVAKLTAREFDLLVALAVEPQHVPNTRRRRPVAER